MAHIKYCDLPNRVSGKSLRDIQRRDSIEVDLLEIDDLFEFQIRLNECVERLNLEKIEVEYKKHSQFTRIYHIIHF